MTMIWSRTTPLLVAILGLAGGCPGRSVSNLSPEDQVGLPGGDAPAGEECQEDLDCAPGHICYFDVCVGSGPLRVSLSFETDSDFDLHVRTPEPGSAEIYYLNRLAKGGYLDVDMCITPCGGGVHVENVFFERTPPSGQFEVFVVNFDGRAEGPFQIEIAGENLQQTHDGYLPVGAGQTSQSFTFSQ
jgi:hypothetical protein